MSYIGVQPSDINLSSVNISDGSVVTNDLADNLITTSKLVSGAVTSVKLASTGVTPGNWTKVTVNAQGQITAGIAATALADYGITDAQPLSSILTNLSGLSGTAGVVRKTGASSFVLDTTTYITKSSSDTMTGDLTMAGNIIPLTDVTYDLGSPTKMWKDIYVGPGSIYMNGKQILQDVSSTIVFSTDVNQNLRIETSGTGNLELQTETGGAVLVKATLNLSSGKRIIDSAGINVEFGNAVAMNGNKITGLGTPSQSGDAATKAYVDGVSTGDSTIVRTSGNQAIAGTKTFSGDVVLQGNLTVSGTTTTVNSQTVLLADNILELNSDFTTGSPTEDSGIQVRRGDLGVASFLWDETSDRFTMKDGAGTGLPLYTTVNITAGSFTGPLTGNASSATRLVNARTINGASFDGTGNISFTTDAVAEGTSNLYFTNGRASAAAPVQTVFGRTGTVVLISSDVTTALTYTPVNLAGDTMSGALTATQFNGPLSGNATTATALATGRTIGMTGDVAWTSASFTGAGNVTGTSTLATVNSNVGSFGSSTAIPVVTVNAKGLVTAVSTAAVVAPASTLTGTTLASGITSATISTLTTSGLQINGGTSASNTGIELGYTGGSAFSTYIDFHSGATAVDYDSRILASGGTGGSGGGNLAITAAATSFSGTVSATSFTGSGAGLSGVATYASIFNNQGQVHATNQDFNAVDFGFRHIQSTTNGPGIPSATQYYSSYVGLGSDYTYSQYGMQTAIARNPSGGNPYLNIRFKEGGTWAGWLKVYAGYADRADTLTSFAGRTDATAYPVVWNVSTGTSQNFSCAAVTIQSSTGTLNASYFNGDFTGTALSANHTWTGTNFFTSNKGSGSYSGSQNTYGLEAYSTDGGSAAMSFHRSGAYAINMGLDPDNVFRIGGWSASANRLQMDTNGNLTMAGDVTAYSDIRVKKNIEVIQDALAKVEQVRGITYERTDNENEGQRQTGVIAQELELVLPEAVKEDASGMKTVAYGNVVGLLIEAIKELNAKVNALQAQLDAKEIHGPHSRLRSARRHHCS